MPLDPVSKAKQLYRIFRYLTTIAHHNWISAVSVAAQRPITLAINFSLWKRPMLERLFPDKHFIYLPAAPSENAAKRLFEKISPVEIFIWGMSSGKHFSQFSNNSDLEIRYFEDGFIRSVGLGSNHVLPLSLCIDGKSVHYNSRQPSSLDEILAKHDFSNDSQLMAQAQECLNLVRTNNLTKYNLKQAKNALVAGSSDEKYILCCGQVEDDESIAFGCDRRIDNNDLIRMAAKENPGKKILYKVHPDYVAGNRIPKSRFSEVAGLCTVASNEIPLHALFLNAERVYTITSLSGFEALMSGIPVTTLGMPFYAGWSLTDDRQAIPSWRGRSLSLEQLFAGAYILYPTYFKPETGERTDLQTTIEYLVSHLKGTNPDSHALEIPNKVFAA